MHEVGNIRNAFWWPSVLVLVSPLAGCVASHPETGTQAPPAAGPYFGYRVGLGLPLGDPIPERHFREDPAQLAELNVTLHSMGASLGRKCNEPNPLAAAPLEDLALMLTALKNPCSRQALQSAIREWNDPTASAWALAHSHYDRAMANFTATMTILARPRTGELVDIEFAAVLGHLAVDSQWWMDRDLDKIESDLRTGVQPALTLNEQLAWAESSFENIAWMARAYPWHAGECSADWRPELAAAARDQTIADRLKGGWQNPNSSGGPASANFDTDVVDTDNVVHAAEEFEAWPLALLARSQHELRRAWWENVSVPAIPTRAEAEYLLKRFESHTYSLATESILAPTWRNVRYTHRGTGWITEDNSDATTALATEVVDAMHWHFDIVQCEPGR